MSTKDAKLIGRYHADEATADAVRAFIRDDLIASELRRSISRTVHCTVHTVRGVDGGDLDVWVDDAISFDPDDTRPIVVETWDKSGSFDGTKRLSLTIPR